MSIKAWVWFRKFSPTDVLKEIPGQWAVGHTRYSTTGSSHAANAQPAVVDSRLGNLALAHNGNIVNVTSLSEDLLKRDHNLVTTSDSELIAIALMEAVNDGKDWIEGAIAAFKRCEGAFSLVIGTPCGIIAARDPHGIRPLVLGYIGSQRRRKRRQKAMAPVILWWLQKPAGSILSARPTCEMSHPASWCGLTVPALNQSSGRRQSASYACLK